VQQILRNNKLPFISDSNKETVCDPCQQGKSHQLPYPKSVSVSNNPLDIVFSNVWGPEVCMQDYSSPQEPGIFSGANRRHFMFPGDSFQHRELALIPE
jgi:hypothetical protein